MVQRKTRQKEEICAALTTLGNHPTADQVFDCVRQQDPNISRATVYRVLHQMAENGTALHIRVIDGADCFDHRTDPHCHAVCNCCHRVYDVSCVRPEVSQFVSSEEIDFKVTDYAMIFTGFCRNCRENEEGCIDHGQ